MNTKRRPTSRKSRNRAKKTKRLSEMQPTAAAGGIGGGDTNSDQVKLHPENEVEERETHDHENVAFDFFSTADGGATTLNGLLENTASKSSHATNNISSRADDLSPSSVSLTYAYDEESGAAFVRNAMRNRERDWSEEEKWVCYSEVVERKVAVKEEEVTSSAVDDRVGNQRLSLKLDYQEILNAWSDKGPLYIHAPDSQVVPDVNDDYFSHVASNNDQGMRWGCNVGGLWTVPEMVGDSNNNNNNNELKMGQREASVLRYKEKRQNRLFSKKIRYQVRKLNAEKRPRLKGRFVKRS
ncbi:hypothetical protein ACJIZ3_018341 [Penstemon smallii]|uniref:CCT domain-containing protein n=1 Tax=Penstemon smallii TaxID=265156 RepID=A0ABD3SY40_9LAMI